MSFPWLLSASDSQKTKELKTGHVVKIGTKFHKVTGKRPWRTEPDSITVGAGIRVVIEYRDTYADPTLAGTVAGTLAMPGYSGNVDTGILRQFKYFALDQATPVQIFWGLEPYVLEAQDIGGAVLTFSSTNINVNRRPLVIDRFSYANSMYLRLIIDRTGLAAGLVNLYLAMIEYDIEEVKPYTGMKFQYINPKGYLLELETYK